VSDFSDSDVARYFGHERLPVPAIERRPVSGGPAAFDPNADTSVEVSLDIQQAGGSAPGARLVVYGAPDLSDSSFLGMYLAIAEDNLADVVSASFGQCELDYTAAYNNGLDLTYLERIYHDLFRQMNAQGMTIVNSSGDFGALECADPSGATAKIGVSSWANDPNVTGVGGTNLVTTYVKGSLESRYLRENAFYDRFDSSNPLNAGLPSGSIFGSGGGKSVVYARPNYQRLVDTHTGARAVPDVAMHMGGCPAGSVTPCGPDRSYDYAYVGGGAPVGLIGTSASAPEFAGLQAIQDAVLGNRQGNVNYLLYSLAAAGSFGQGPIFNDDVPGSNGCYRTTRGYNYVLGNGSVNGAQYALEPFGPFAGEPQSASNP
jgi:subtilase family serine protease